MKKVFSTEKYKEDMTKSKVDVLQWGIDCDGIEVNDNMVISPKSGAELYVLDEWCIEVEEEEIS